MGMMEELWPYKALCFIPSFCSDWPDLLHLSDITDKSLSFQTSLNQNQSPWCWRQYVLPKRRITRILQFAETQQKTDHLLYCALLVSTVLFHWYAHQNARLPGRLLQLPCHVNPQQHRTELLCSLTPRTDPNLPTHRRWCCRREMNSPACRFNKQCQQSQHETHNSLH